jgi:hypothetical protein
VEWISEPTSEPERQLLLDTIRRVAREVEERRVRRLLKIGEAEGIGRRQVLHLLKNWDPGVSDDLVDDLLGETTAAGTALITELLDKLAEVRAILVSRTGDAQELQAAFGPFKEAVLNHLWDLYEDADPHHRQIASELDLAVRKLSSLSLEEEHIDALEFVLQRLAQPQVSDEDLQDCERVFAYRGLETLIDLGEHRGPLLDIYLGEDEEKGDEEIG